MTRDRAFHEAQRSIKAAFFFMGLPVGALVPRLAEIKLHVGATEGSYGSAFAVGALGALAGNYLGSYLVHHHGSRAVARRAFYGILAANLANALAPNVGWLAIVALTSGLSYALTNIAVNSQGVLVEQGIGRSFLPTGHAFWSIGAMSAAIASSMAAPHTTPLQALMFADVSSMIGFAVATTRLLPTAFDDRPHDDPTQLRRTERIPASTLRFLLTIAVAQWLGLIAELSVGDWSSVLMHESYGIAVGPNGYGFATFMLVQLVLRLVLPRLIDRHSLRTVMRAFGLVGAFGYLACLNLANVASDRCVNVALIAVCAAYGFMAVGVAVMPSGFASAAGSVPGIPSARALMVVGVATALLNFGSRTLFAYVAQAVTLPLALQLMGVALIAASLMAGVTDRGRVTANGFTRG